MAYQRKIENMKSYYCLKLLQEREKEILAKFAHEVIFFNWASEIIIWSLWGVYHIMVELSINFKKLNFRLKTH